MISREFRRLAATEIWKVSQRNLQISIPLLRIGRKPRGKNHWKENYRVKAGFKSFKIVIEFPTKYLSIRKFLNLRKEETYKRFRALCPIYKNLQWKGSGGLHPSLTLTIFSVYRAFFGSAEKIEKIESCPCDIGRLQIQGQTVLSRAWIFYQETIRMARKRRTFQSKNFKRKRLEPECWFWWIKLPIKLKLSLSFE